MDKYLASFAFSRYRPIIVMHRRESREEPFVGASASTTGVDLVRGVPSRGRWVVGELGGAWCVSNGSHSASCIMMCDPTGGR